MKKEMANDSTLEESLIRIAMNIRFMTLKLSIMRDIMLILKTLNRTISCRIFNALHGLV